MWAGHWTEQLTGRQRQSVSSFLTSCVWFHSSSALQFIPDRNTGLFTTSLHLFYSFYYFFRLWIYISNTNMWWRFISGNNWSLVECGFITPRHQSSELLPTWWRIGCNNEVSHWELSSRTTHLCWVKCRGLIPIRIHLLLFPVLVGPRELRTSEKLLLPQHQWKEFRSSAETHNTEFLSGYETTQFKTEVFIWVTSANETVSEKMNSFCSGGCEEDVFNRREPSLSLNQPSDVKGQNIFILFYFVYMWRTLPPSQLQTVLWVLIFLWEQLVYSHGYFCVNIVNINILSLNFLSRTESVHSYSEKCVSQEKFCFL